MLSSPNRFCVQNEGFCFEVLPPPYTSRPLQMVDPESMRLEDRFHRTVRITRPRDSRVWTGAADLRPQFMNDLATYLGKWLADSFAQWDLDSIPDGFEIPQGAVPREPGRHHCAEFPLITSEEAGIRSPDIVETASEQSFPASDPPEWTGTRVA